MWLTLRYVYNLHKVKLYYNLRVDLPKKLALSLIIKTNNDFKYYFWEESIHEDFEKIDGYRISSRAIF